MTTTRIFDVTIGDRETTIQIFPRHLEGREADSFRDAFDYDRIDVLNLVRERAVRKLWGPACSWWADSGVRGFGQVVTPARHGTGHHCVTPRVRAEVTER